MARNVSDEELQLKKRARRRLVGAIVLVTAVAVVLPMILDSEPKPASQSIDIQIPSPEAGVLSAKPAPLKSAEKPAAAAASAEPVVPPAAEAKTESKPEIKAETKAEAKAAVKPQQAAPAKPATKPEGTAKARDSAKEKPKAAAGSFVIQVAALSDAAKARELQAKIAGGGLKAYTEVVQTAKGPVTRVRVGPYASREAAEKARPSLQRLHLDGKVIPR
jgi:DedD protein